MVSLPSDAAAEAAKSFLAGTMTPAEAILLHLQIGRHMQGNHHGTDPKSWFKFATNAAWQGGLAETLVALLFAEADGPDWSPNHEAYIDAALRKRAGGKTEELRAGSVWRDSNRGARGSGAITDVDLFVPRDGLQTGYWRHFQPSIPETFTPLLAGAEQAFGCQVKLRLDWQDKPDDDSDSLHWKYFVEDRQFDLIEFLDKPVWLPKPVDLFAVLKFETQQGGVTVRGRIFDKFAVQEQILRSVDRRISKGTKSLAFGSQRFSFGECMSFPAGTGIEVSEPLTRLIGTPVPTE